MEYRHVAGSVEGFVQQLAANYLPHGYFFYVQGVVPEGKDPQAIDEKLLSKYGIRLSRQARARRKQTGEACLHYMRFDRVWVLLATNGRHPFFALEGGNIRDVRRQPIQFRGYSISVKRGDFLRKLAEDEPATPDGKLRVRVQISREMYREVRAYFLEMATRRGEEWLSREIYLIPFEPYAPIRRQLLRLLRLVNAKRQSAGLSKLSPDCLRFRRRIVKPFAGDSADAAPTDDSSKSARQCEPASVGAASVACEAIQVVAPSITF